MSTDPPAPLPPSNPSSGPPTAGYFPSSDGSLTQQDIEHLNMLSICWYVWAALLALPALIFLFWIVIFAVLSIIGLTSKDTAPASLLGGFFVCFLSVLMCFVLLMSYLNYRCGKNLRIRRGITLCYIMAGIACVNVPLGLILGIFTFMALSRPGVKTAFR
jgi:hypothetical protein